MADNPNNQYVPKIALTKVLQAIRAILGDVSPAGIEAVGNFISGGGQTIESALFELDNALSEKSNILNISVAQVGDNKYTSSHSYDEIVEAYRNGYAIFLNGNACDRISVDEYAVQIGVSDSYVFTSGGSQVYYTRWVFYPDGTITSSRNTINLLSYGDGTQFLANDGNYKSLSIPTKTSQLANDSGFLQEAVTVTDFDNTTIPLTKGGVEIGDSTIDAVVLTLVYETYLRKQIAYDCFSNNIYTRYYKDVWYDWTKVTTANDFKTVNGQSIVGSGNISIEGGSSSSGGSGAYPLVTHSADDTTVLLTPNTFHVWEEVEMLDLGFGAETTGVSNEYLFQFNSGTTATTLTLPNHIKWANDEVPTIEPNMIYQVSVLNGLATMLAFSNAPELIENKATFDAGSFSTGATLTFEYPVASDLTIMLTGYSTDSIVMSKGSSSITIEWFEPVGITVLGFLPDEDSIYKYVL